MRGVHQAADLSVTHETRITAAREVVGGRAVLAGPSAAWALGCELAGSGDPAHVVITTGSTRPRAMLVRHRMRLTADEVVDTPLGPATSPARTAVDLACGMGLSGQPNHRRIAWLDGLIRVSSVTAADARRAVAQATSMRGLEAARGLVATARDGVDSPKETELRLLVVRLGFPEPFVQCPVVDAAGRVFARLDMGWPEYLSGLEYDGAVHRDPAQHSRDLVRHNRIRAADWTVLQIDARGLLRPGTWLQALTSRIPRT